MLTGIPVSKGISIGEAHILDRSKLCVLKQTIDSSDIDKEINRFRIAIEQTKKQMQETKKTDSHGCLFLSRTRPSPFRYLLLF